MNTNPKLPQDANNNPFNRSMGTPVCCTTKIVGSSTQFRDMISLDPGRVYLGIMIENPSLTKRLQIAIGNDWASTTCIDLLPQGLATFDGQTFGFFADESTGIEQSTKLRAKLNAPEGTLATGTFTNSGQPSDAQTILINGIIYEWSADGSVVPGRVRVPILGTAALSYAQLRDRINDNDPNIIASLAGNILTITSNLGGSDGNQIPISIGTTSNVVASAAFLSGGTGGVTPIIHIW